MLILDWLEGLSVSGGAGVLIPQPCVKKPGNPPGTAANPYSRLRRRKHPNAAISANQHN